MKTNNISPELSSKEISKIIEDIKKDYAFLNLSAEDLIEISTAGRVSENSILDTKKLENKIRIIIKEYISQNISEDVFDYLLCEKLNRELKLSKNPLDMLEKVCNFLKRIGYDLKVEQIKNILVNVPIVNKAIKTLVNKYIEIINNGEMDRISEIPLILMFLEVYCDEHDIKTIPDDRVEIESAYIDKDLHSKVYELLDKCNLTANEKEVLVLRFGLNGKEGLTLEATGKTLSLTKERIRQIEAKALHKLRKAKYIKEFAIYMNKPSRAIEYIDDSRRLSKAAIVEDQNIEIEVIALEDISTDLLPNLREILESLTAKKQKVLLLYLGYYLLLHDLRPERLVLLHGL